MSKYDDLRTAMGGNEWFNDRVTTGRVLKWYDTKTGGTLKERKAQAAEIFKRLQDAGCKGVLKVQVREATASAMSFDADFKPIFASWQDNNKICVYIETR